MITEELHGEEDNDEDEDEVCVIESFYMREVEMWSGWVLCVSCVFVLGFVMTRFTSIWKVKDMKSGQGKSGEIKSFSKKLGLPKS